LGKFLQLFKQTITYGIATVFPRIISVILVRVHTDKSVIGEVSEFGTLSLIFSYIILFNVILSYGLETSFFRFYNKEKNIVIWQRKLTRALVKSAENILTLSPTLKITAVVRPEDKCLSLKKALGSKVISQSLLKDIENLVEMFCFLFGLKQAGLRLTALDNAMCPRFHVDRVPCRLLTTYHGIATEWIPHTFADRKKLGSGNQGMSDEQSGLIQTLNEIQ